MTLEPCPECAASFPPSTGPRHPYIGASAGCWAFYAAVLAGGEPEAAVLASSSAAAVSVDRSEPTPDAAALLIDAYAAQHHGVPSARAVQSVAVHLLVLHGVLARAAAPDAALWIRRQAVWRKGRYEWLSPPPVDAAYSLRHCFPSPGGEAPVSIAAYVTSVYASWRRHHAQLDRWYDVVVAA